MRKELEAERVSAAAEARPERACKYDPEKAYNLTSKVCMQHLKELGACNEFHCVLTHS